MLLQVLERSRNLSIMVTTVANDLPKPLLAVADKESQNVEGVVAARQFEQSHT